MFLISISILGSSLQYPNRSKPFSNNIHKIKFHATFLSLNIDGGLVLDESRRAVVKTLYWIVFLFWSTWNFLMLSCQNILGSIALLTPRQIWPRKGKQTISSLHNRVYLQNVTGSSWIPGMYLECLAYPFVARTLTVLLSTGSDYQPPNEINVTNPNDYIWEFAQKRYLRISRDIPRYPNIQMCMDMFSRTQKDIFRIC